MRFIKLFSEIRLSDVAEVGGKNASLGQMMHALGQQGILIPDGFALTASAYWEYLQYNAIEKPLRDLIESLPATSDDIETIERIGKKIRSLLYNAEFPERMRAEIEDAYKKLSEKYHEEKSSVAVRSSATAEDLPTASFAGQQETFLHVSGLPALLDACKRCIASLFTDRAIVYRIEHNFDHMKVALSVGVQKMVYSDCGSAGVAFSLDTESGFKDVIIINASYGLGEAVVQGLVTPDEYSVYKKPISRDSTMPIINKKRGDKKIKMVYDQQQHAVVRADVPEEQQNRYVLSDDTIQLLAQQVATIEHYFTNIHKQWAPVDVEWAIDVDHALYIVQARPETVHAHHHAPMIQEYNLDSHQTQSILTGQSIGQAIASGRVKVMRSLADRDSVCAGDILVAEMTDPDWVSVMKKAAGIITDKGGRTCHAAIVSRELGIPAIVGTGNATQILKDGMTVTLDCSKGSTGFIYPEKITWTVKKYALESIPKVSSSLMLNLADPDRAFALSALPVDGVGLARIEFIIASWIKIHPLALVHPNLVTNAEEKKNIQRITVAYADKKQFFIDTLAYGIATIAAAFYPRKVVVRFSDFKTNEYRNLIGGSYFEPIEENPMLGYRGALRYYAGAYQEAFALEAAALLKVRNDLGFTNVAVMVPFVRTVDQAHKVIACLQEHGLSRGKNDLQIIMMCEIPANVLCIDALSNLFDGFSIGSNDLTQLMLGVDRDSPLLATLFDERDEAVKAMMQQALAGAKRNKRPIGICGQAPSDFPDIAAFLIKLGIDSISLNPDSVLPFLFHMQEE